MPIDFMPIEDEFVDVPVPPLPARRVNWRRVVAQPAAKVVPVDPNAYDPNFLIKISNELREDKLEYICAHCKKIVTQQDKFESYNGGSKINKAGQLQIICVECLVHFEQCEACKSYFKKKSLQKGFCRPCIDRAPETHIHEYRYNVENELGMRGEEPKDRIYYGIELEFESENVGLDVLIVNSLIKEIARLKRDSSIKNGFEIVSAPAIIEEHYYIWDNFFEKLPLTCKPLDSCGMHVHASRDRLSYLQIGKILMFLHAKENRKFIELIAGRCSSFQNNFETNKTFGDVQKPLLDKNGRPDHHTALNLNKENTIEFRIFWATRDKRIFLKNIEFCRALIKFTDWATNSLYDSTNYQKFVEFVMKNRKDYEYLALFFHTPSMQELLER